MIKMNTLAYGACNVLLVAGLMVGCATPQQPTKPVETQPETKRLPDGSYEINVDARAGWVSTTIELKEGQTVKIHAEGQWGESRGVNRTADGGQAGMFGSGYWGVSPLVPGPAAWGALVGRVGGGPAFLIGSRYTLKVDRTGLLQISINDGLAQMADNHGAMRVYIEVVQ
jgi:hypothetical protein